MILKIIRIDKEIYYSKIYKIEFFFFFKLF